MIASFAYDGDGKRVRGTINGVSTNYVGTYYEETATVATKYYYAGAQRVAMRTAGVVFYLLGDQVGSTSISTDASGTLLSELRYKAWGEVRYAFGVTPTKYTYTGQYSNVGEFGLLFYNARWYDPALSHFAQADTIVPGVGGSGAWDKYAYTVNNPLRYVDPSGNEPHGPGSCYDSIGGRCGYRSAEHPNVLVRGSLQHGDKYGRASDSLAGMLPRTVGMPFTVTLHPLDGNVISRVPIYDYSVVPPKLIGYRITSYAIDDADFDPLTLVPSLTDPEVLFEIANHGVNSFLRGFTELANSLIPFVDDVVYTSICPECEVAVGVASFVYELNESITFDEHLRTYDTYIWESPLVSPLDDPYIQVFP